MHQLRFMYRQFLREPWWFKLLISVSLFISLVFSSSSFPAYSYYQSAAKLAAAVFFCAYGLKLRRSPFTAAIMLCAALLCFYLGWYHFSLARLSQ